MIEQPHFLPISLQDCKSLGIDQLDIILICGDAYVDHPSFGTALIGRVLWDAGYFVGIVAQPDWRSNEDLRALGRPRLFYGVSSGNVDSMVNNFTPNLKRRSWDVYSPGGALHRPDRALIVYANIVHALYLTSRSSSEGSRQAYAGLPTMIIGQTLFDSPSWRMRRKLAGLWHGRESPQGGGSEDGKR